MHPAIQLLTSGLTLEKTGKESTDAVCSYVDSRDSAETHVLALTTEAAGNERILTCASKLLLFYLRKPTISALRLYEDNFSWQDVYDVLREEPPFEGYPRGPQPGSTRGKVWEDALSRDKVQRIFGKTEKELFRPFSATIRDTVADLKIKGWEHEWPRHRS
jgi:hypothetical protein